MQKEVKYTLFILLGAAIITTIPVAIGRKQAVEYAQARQELLEKSPSPTTSIFRQSVAGATEVRLYDKVTELYSKPQQPSQDFLKGEPRLVLRGEQVKELVKALHFEDLSQRFTPIKRDVASEIPALEFYKGKTRVAELRLFSFEHVRFYAPLAWRGDGHLNTTSARYIMNLHD